MSDRTSTAWALDLGDLVAGPDRRLLRSLNPAQRSAQLQARGKLYRHLQSVHRSADSTTRPDVAAAIMGALEFVGALLDAATAEHDSAEDTHRTKARIPLQAPPALWPAAPAPPAAVQTSAPRESDPAKPTMCRRCGSTVVWTQSPEGGHWAHSVGRKSHVADPLSA